MKKRERRKSKSKKVWLIILIVIIVLVGVISVLFYLNYKKEQNIKLERKNLVEEIASHYAENVEVTKDSNLYQRNGKKYIKVKHPSTGNIREVRWYNFQEYAAAYGKAAAEAQPNPYGGLKQARGFSEGPILIIRNSRNLGIWHIQARAQIVALLNLCKL